MILVGLVHIAISSLLALILSLAFGHLTAFIAAISLLIGWMGGIFARATLRKATPEYRFNFWHSGIDGVIEKVVFALLVYVCVRHFSFLFYLSTTSYKTLDVSNYGDLPLHIDYIRAMSLKNPFPLLNPSFSHDLLRYPYGIDLYNALWDSLGVPLSSHLFFVGLFGSVASLVALRAFASWFGMIGFFLSGGFISWMWSSTPLAGQLAGQLSAQEQWKNLFLTVFVTQRGFLFALPVGLLVLAQLTGESANRKVSTFWAGILWGSLAFFHIHTFIAISLLIPLVALMKKNLRPAWQALGVAFPIGSIFVLFSTDMFKRASIMRIDMGWMHKGSETLGAFLSFNFGAYLYLFLVLIGLLCWSVYRRKEPILQLKLLFVYLAVFILFFNVMLAPWAWDNIKVLIWPYLGLLSIAFIYFKNRMPAAVKVFVAIILSFTGFVQIAPTLVSTATAPTLFEVEKLANCEGATRDLPRAAVFIAADTHLHPLNYFGRNRALGYPGHLWSHGINAQKESMMQSQILKDDPNWKQLAKELGANYIYWGPDERQIFGNQPRSWQSSLRNVSRVESVSVYEVK